MNLRRVARGLPAVGAGAVRGTVVRARHLPLRAEDVVLASYPKAGNTWLRFVLVSALTGRDVDFDTVARDSPPLGHLRGANAVVPGGGRLVKSHDLPLLRPFGPQPRLLNLVRDGRDVAVSYYHHRRRKGLAPPTFHEYLEAFLAGDSGPYGSWQRHALAWRDTVAARPDTALTVRYEDLRADPVATLARVSDHLGLGLTDERVTRALETHELSRMRAKASESTWLAERTADTSISFVRGGRSGDWREVFDEAEADRFDAVAGDALRALGYPAR